MEAYTGRTPTRKVDALVEVLGGLSGITRSEVIRICLGLDEQVKFFCSGHLIMPASPTSPSTPPIPTDANWSGTCRSAPWASWFLLVTAARNPKGYNALGDRKLLGIALSDSEAEA